MSHPRIIMAAVALALVACTTSSTSTTGAGASSVAPGTAPTGRIVFDQTPNGAEDPESAFIVNADGTDEHRLQVPTQGLVKDPMWSPDGTLLFVLTEHGPAIVASDGSGFKLLHPEIPGLDSCIWSPDRKRLLCRLTDRGNLDGLYSFRTSDGGGLTRLTTSPNHDDAVCGGGGGDVPGDYSPDGTRFVFVRAKCATDESSALYVENTDGTGLRRITPYVANGPGDPAWSPGGSEILFSRDCKLYLVHPDGTDQTSIPEDSCAFAPDWSPDGRWIVASFNQPEGSPDLFTALPDGTELTRITDTPGSKEILTSWGPPLEP